jgi:hypothetical protein
MRTFVEKPKASQQVISSKTTVPDRSRLRHSHEAKSILSLGRTIGNQAVQQLLQSNAEEHNTKLTAVTTHHFGHDFSRIPIHSSSAGAIQSRIELPSSEDKYETKADRIAGQMMATHGSQLQHDREIDTPVLVSTQAATLDRTNARRTKLDSGGSTLPVQVNRLPSSLTVAPPALQNTPPGWLPPDTPAWAERGRIGLGPAFFQADHMTQADILRHEYIHALHQCSAALDNSASARRNAEALASATHLAPKQAINAPAPAILAFPPQKHKPWDQVYIGNSMIIGELTLGDLVLRIKMDYSEFKVEDVFKHNKDLDMDLIETEKATVYHCGKHPNINLVDKVKKLRVVLSKVEQLNNKIPVKSTFKIKYVFVAANASERFRTVNNQGVLFLSSNTLDTGIVDAAAHEASHGIFEHHATAGDADPAKRVPDNLALQVADIFAKLKNTKAAAVPQTKFNPKSPPPYESTDSTRQPAGIIPIHDTVWSGEGGHPWNAIDEFFASAFAAFTQEPKLLDKIIDYYNKHDPSIRPLYTQLFNLFKNVGNAKSLASVAAPSDKKAAEKMIGQTSAPPDYTTPDRRLISDRELFDPTLLPGPDKISCKTGAAAAEKKP